MNATMRLMNATRRMTMNNRGFALPLAILVIVALGLIGAGAAWMSAGDTNISMLYASSNHASDAAGAGIEHAVALYDERLDDYNPAQDGPLGSYLLAGDWPLEDHIDGYDYTVMISRDSFDFDGDGDKEAVSCDDSGASGGSSGGSGGGSGGSGGGGSGTDGGSSGGDGYGGASTPADTTKYWEDGSTSDKNGDGELGFAEGHFDVDVFASKSGSVSEGREYHQHQFDDKYDTKSVDLFNDPNLLWDELVGKHEDAYANNLRMEFINQDSARGTFSITIKGTTTNLDLQTAGSMTFAPKDLKGLRVTFASLGSLRKTNPGAVKGDAVLRDHSWTVRFYDTVTGRLVYENSEYWHYNKSGGSAGGSSSGGSTTTTTGGRNCKNAAGHEADARKHEDRAREHEAKAAEALAKGDSKKAADEQAKADTEWARAAEDWAAAESDCSRAKAAGENCVCGNYSGGSEEGGTTTPPDTTSTPPDTTSSPGSSGSNGGGNMSCTVNGYGAGDPVFVLRSMAVRGSWRASQSLRLTSADAKRVIRLSWLAD